MSAQVNFTEAGEETQGDAGRGFAALLSAPWVAFSGILEVRGLAARGAALPWLSVSKAIRDEPGRLFLRISAAAFESELSTALR